MIVLSDQEQFEFDAAGDASDEIAAMQKAFNDIIRLAYRQEYDNIIKICYEMLGEDPNE
jgi:hypothetical protein